MDLARTPLNPSTNGLEPFHKFKWGRAICPVVWIYYIWTTGQKKGDGGISRIISFVGENERKRKEKRNFRISFFFRLVTPRTQSVFFWEVYALLGLSVKVATLFFTKSVKFGFGELSISRICAESHDLQSEHGFRACSFKNSPGQRPKACHIPQAVPFLLAIYIILW